MGGRRWTAPITHAWPTAAATAIVARQGNKKSLEGHCKRPRLLPSPAKLAFAESSGKVNKVMGTMKTCAAPMTSRGGTSDNCHFDQTMYMA